MMAVKYLNLQTNKLRWFVCIMLVQFSLLPVVIVTYYRSFSSSKLMLISGKPDCDDQLLCMFTTFKPVKHKLPVRIDIIRTLCWPDSEKRHCKNITTEYCINFIKNVKGTYINIRKKWRITSHISMLLSFCTLKHYCLTDTIALTVRFICGNTTRWFHNFDKLSPWLCLVWLLGTV